MTELKSAYLNKKQSYFLIALCFAVYTAGYIGRLNYSASLIEILSAFGADKTAGGLVSSFFFFAYGVGQLVNGILCKHYNPRIMIFLSLAVSAVVNSVMPFSGGLSAMKWLWLINGIAQSVLWCTIIKTLSKYVSDELLPKAILVMSTTNAVGTFCAYGLSALGIAIGFWQLAFFCAAAVLAAAGLGWFFGLGILNKQVTAQEVPSAGKEDMPLGTVEKKKKIHVSFCLALFAVAVCVAAIANGFIKGGTVTWTPSILYEEFGMNKSFSVVLTFCLPLLSVFGAFMASGLNKKIKNFGALISVFFSATLVFLSFLVSLSLPSKELISTLILFILISCCMAAVNNIIASMIPLHYRDRVDSGLLAGVMDTFCYVGSTLSTVLLGFVADTRGWNAVFIVMIIFAAVTLVLSVLSIVRQSGKRKNRSEEKQ